MRRYQLRIVKFMESHESHCGAIIVNQDSLAHVANLAFRFKRFWNSQSDENDKEDLSTISTQIHTWSNSVSCTASDMETGFGIYLRQSELLEEDKKELDGQGL